MNRTPQASAPVPSGFFVIRTPLLPFDELTAWGASLEAATATPPELPVALASDRIRLRTRLIAIVNRPEIREALFVASPSVEESIDHWLAEPDSDRGQRTERALVKYVSRMAGRATPFGLFAGCTVGRIGGATRLELAGYNEHRRHTRLDMDYLYGLFDRLLDEDAVRRTLSYRPNSSLYELAGRLRYVEGRLSASERSYHLVSADPDDALRETLERSVNGASYQVLRDALVGDEVSAEEADGYIQELIDAQILVPDATVPVTIASGAHDGATDSGDSAAATAPTSVLIQTLRAHQPTREAAQVLAEVTGSLARIDALGLGAPLADYRAIRQTLEERLPAKVDRARLFQVDLVTASRALTLGVDIVDELARGIELLRRIARKPAPAELTAFRDRFVERYEQREVPLVEALDDECGIGFGANLEAAPLLRELRFPTSPESGTWGERDAILLRKVTAAVAEGGEEIVLEPRDIDALADPDPLPLPDAFDAAARMMASAEAAARGDFRIRLLGAQGPSGARLLGRFCYADPGLRRSVEQHLRAEEALAPEAIFAEIVHLPEGRLGNILFRPVLRQHEIPYLGHSGVAHDRQIPITDLLVSVVNGRIVLRSASLGRPIVPRLSTAHNFQRESVPVYRFLCLLQSQGLAAALGWDWGPLNGAPFLPRVRSGRLVLAPARWRVESEEVKLFAAGTAAERFTAVQAWRRQRRLPRWVVLADGDNTLPVDLENILSIEAFIQQVKDRQLATVEEFTSIPGELCVTGPDGRFVHELLVPFVRSEPLVASRPVSVDSLDRPLVPAAASQTTVNSIRRQFLPGSEWLFVKMYSGSATADQLLCHTLSPVIQRAQDEGQIDQWFFMRYADPDPHIRIRFHGDPDVLHGYVWKDLRAALVPCIDNSLAHRVVLDTYSREIERYGGAQAMLLGEQIFHADSSAVLELLERLEAADTGQEERWRLGLYGVDRMLADFGFDLSSRHAFATRQRQAHAKGYRADRGFDRQLGARYRSERTTIDEVLTGSGSRAKGLEPGFEILQARSRRLAPVLMQLRALDAAGRLSMPYHEIVASHIHMHMNRLCRARNREHEFVVYDFLARYYESLIRRERRIDRPQAFATLATA